MSITILIVLGLSAEDLALLGGHLIKTEHYGGGMIVEVVCGSFDVVVLHLFSCSRAFMAHLEVKLLPTYLIIYRES